MKCRLRLQALGPDIPLPGLALRILQSGQLGGGDQDFRGAGHIGQVQMSPLTQPLQLDGDTPPGTEGATDLTFVHALVPRSVRPTRDGSWPDRIMGAQTLGLASWDSHNANVLPLDRLRTQPLPPSRTGPHG